MPLKFSVAELSERSPSAYPMVFGYGTLLDSRITLSRCPSAVLVGTGAVAGRRFQITSRGVATLVRSPRSVVHGTVWQISDPDLAVLDQLEGIPHAYTREAVGVQLIDGRRVDAEVYLATTNCRGKPRPGYLDAVIEGAVDLDLPGEYIAELLE